MFRATFLAASLLTAAPIALLAQSAAVQKEDAREATVAMKPAATLRQVVEVRSEATDTQSAISIIMNGEEAVPQNSYEIAEHGIFLQVNFRDALIANPGQFIEGKGPIVKKIAIFQVDETTAAVRIFVKGSIADFKKSMHAEVLANRLLLSFDHKAIPTKLAAGVAAAKAGAKGGKGDEANAGGAPLAAAAHTGGPNLDLDAKMRVAAMFSGGMLMLLMIVWMLKPRLMRKRIGKGMPKQGSEFRSLGSYAVAPRQKITVIEVDGEKILLAVSASGVQYLTKLEAPIFASNMAGAGMNGLPAGQGLPSRLNAASGTPQQSFAQSYKQGRPVSPAPQAATLSFESASEKLPDAARKVLQTIRRKHPAPSAGQVAAPAPMSAQIGQDAKAVDPFNDLLNESESGNEEAAPVASTSAKSAKAPAKKGQSVRVKIDDNGITDLAAQRKSTHHDDITAMIRSKLKELPKIM